MLIREDVERAADRTRSHVRTTPVFRADPGEAGTPAGAEVYFVCEYLQHTGSFKARGAMNRLLCAQESGELGDVGVVAASGGNAGLGAAYAASRLGVGSHIFVPATAPQIKVDKLRSLGAQVHQVGSEYAEAYEASQEYLASAGGVFVHAYDQAEVCAGAGTLGLQIDAQLPEIDTVLVAVGGGGLMGGVAAALKGRAAVVGVEPVSIPTWHDALAAGGPVDVEVSGIAADALGARRLGSIGYETAVDAGAKSVLVGDEAIIAARRRLWDSYRIVVEHGTSAAFAALAAGAYVPAEGERVAVILCGANTDLASLLAP